MAGTMAEKGKTKEQDLQNAIEGLKGFPDAYTLINKRISPSQNPKYEEFLTTKGYTFFFPDTKEAQDAANAFAKKLNAMGYEAIVVRDLNIDGETYSYMLHIGRAAEQAAKSATATEQEKADQKKREEIADRMVEETKKKIFGKPSKAQAEVLAGGEPTAEEKKKLEEQIPESSRVPQAPAKKAEEKPKTEITQVVPSAPEKKAREKELARLEAEFNKQLESLAEKTEPWGKEGNAKIVQAYKVLVQIKAALEKEGRAMRGEEEIRLDSLLAGDKKRPGEVVRVENAIKETQDAYKKADELLTQIWQTDPQKGIELAEKLRAYRKTIGDEILTYGPSPIKVRTEEGYDVYARAEKKGKTVYALSDQIAVEESKALIADAEVKERNLARLYEAGLIDDPNRPYQAARETLVNNLTTDQILHIIDYAQGRTDSLSLTVDPKKQGDIEKAIKHLCFVNGFLPPSFDPLAAAGQIKAEGKPRPLPLSEEALKKLDEWDTGKFLTAKEKQLLATQFSYQDITTIIDMIDRCRLAFSEGREPNEFLSGETGGVLVPKGGLNLETVRALNSLFLYAGGLSASFYESGGYLYSSIPTMYTEPEKIMFKFPKKISHKEDTPGALKRYLNLEISKEHPESDVSHDILRKITTAINSGKGGEVQIGEMQRETPEDAREYSAYLKKARIIAGYLNDQGINAKVVEFSVYDPKKDEDRNGVKIVIPENAMGWGEVGRKPNQIEVVQEPTAKEAAKVDPRKEIQKLPPEIATASMKNAMLSFVKEERAGTITCSSQDQATKLRNWLITNAGIAPEKLEITSADTESKVATQFEGETTVKGTKWMLTYSPEPVTRLALSKLPERGEAPYHRNEAQAAALTKERSAKMESALADSVDKYQKAHPEQEVTYTFSQASGTRKAEKKPDAKGMYHTETDFLDGVLGMAFEYGRRLQSDPEKEPPVGGYKRLRDSMKEDLSALTPEGKFKHGDRFGMMMLEVWRSHTLSQAGRKGFSDAYGVLVKKYANLEEFKKVLTPENAIKLEAVSNWLADLWLTQYDTKGMKPEEVETLRSALVDVAWRSLIVVIQMEAGPAHYGRGSGTERPQTPEDHFAGAVLYMQNTEFYVKGEKQPRTTYFEYEGVRYNILSRYLSTPGPDSVSFATVPTKDPNKVILYGRLKRENVQLEDGTWIPAYTVEKLTERDIEDLRRRGIRIEKDGTRIVAGKDSLGEGCPTPMWTGPYPYGDINFKDKPRGKPIEGKAKLYKLSYEGLDLTDVKFPGKQVKPYLGVLVTSKREGEETTGPDKKEFITEDTEFSYSVVMKVGEGEKTKRFLMLSADSEKKHAHELSTKWRFGKVSSTAELANDGNIYVYWLGNKIIDADYASTRFSVDKKRITVGERNKKGEIVPDFEDFTAEELATMPGLIEEDGKLYLDITRENIGTYSLTQEGEKGKERENVRISLKADKEEHYGDLVRTVLKGKQITDVASINFVSVKREEGEEPETKVVEKAKSNATLVSVPVNLAKSVHTLGLTDEYYNSAGGFTKRPTYYVAGEELK